MRKISPKMMNMMRQRVPMTDEPLMMITVMMIADEW